MGRLLVALMVSGALLGDGQARAEPRHRNLFDPLYAFDDIDAHTVSAGSDPQASRSASGQNQYPQFNRSSSSSSGSQLLGTSGGGSASWARPPGDDAGGQSEGRGTHAEFGARLRTSGGSAQPRPFASLLDGGPPHTQGPAYTLRPLKSLGSALGGDEGAKGAGRLLVQSSIGSAGEQQPAVQQEASPADQGGVFASTRLGPWASAAPTSTTERPRHWSALENYYQRLRDAALLRRLQAASQTNQDQELGYLMLAQQQQAGDEPKLRHLSSGGKLAAAAHSQQRPIYRGDQQEAAPPLTRQNFLLPGSGGGGASGGVKSAYELAAELARNQDSYYQLGGRGEAQLAAAGSKSAARPAAELERPSLLDQWAPAGELWPVAQKPGQQQQWAPRPLPGALPALPIEQQQLELAPDEEGRVRQFELNKLDELVRIQLMQRRLRHQQDTFGPWYDLQRNRQLMQEEAFCGPRNFVRYHYLAPAASSRPSLASGGAGSRPAESQSLGVGRPAELTHLLALAEGGAPEGADARSVPVGLSAGEFPSHMGVYNGSQPATDNYLCAATWVHERFALTLASCVAKWNATGGAPEAPSLLPGTVSSNQSSLASGASSKRPALTVRAGEWNLGRSSKERPLVVRPVDKVHLFPRFHTSLLASSSSSPNTSGQLAADLEHNLALLEWSAPIDYLQEAYIWPACQMQSRQTLRTSACWSPIRNVSQSEFFDPEGEGETKLRQSVQMVEVPVKLFANDELECQRQTGLQYFNFLHPNYICSADARRSSWRAKLNSAHALGSGIYCNEGGHLSLVSILHPVGGAQKAPSNATFGYLDLSYYRPWMRSVIAGRQ